MPIAFTCKTWATGVQRIHRKYATASDAVGLIISVFASTFLLHVINVLFILPSYPSEMLLMAGLLALIGFLSIRYRRQLLTGLQVRLSRIRTLGQAARERVLVVGAGEAGQLTLWLLQNSPSARAFYVVGVVDDDLNKLGSLVHRVPVLGLCERIPQLVEEHDVGMILFAIHSIHWQRRNEILEICWSTSARTVVAPDILTFMRKGTDPSDRRTWFPEAEAEDNEVGPSNGFTKDELRQDIHRLAQMARHGDYAELARYLIELDRELQTGSKEVASKKIDIAA
jgi:FlaA1/EpsC-like NDP-sugar epimerase